MLFIEEALPGVCHVLIFIQKRISSRLQSTEELFKKVTHSAYMLFLSIKDSTLLRHMLKEEEHTV